MGKNNTSLWGYGEDLSHNHTIRVSYCTFQLGHPLVWVL